jgi:hypothetical protein
LATLARTSGLVEEQWPSTDRETEIRENVASNVDRDLTVVNLRTRELYIQYAKAAENATQRARVDARIGGC